MKDLIRCAALVVLALVVFACEGEDGAVGPQGEQGIQGTSGEQGPQGEEGPQGETGDPGTANVIYSDWVANEFSNNIISTSASFTIEATNITNETINEGVVLVYARAVEPDLSNRTYQLPMVFGGARQQSYYFSIPNGGQEIRISVMANEQGESVGDASFFAQFRYVVIPGGQASGRSPQELKNMSYQEVAALFNIND